MHLWGTCAGAILLATENVGNEPCLGLIDIAVQRNAFGSQLDSFNCTALVAKVSPEPLPLTFIRAPKILRVGADVDVLLQLDGFVAAAETETVLATVFHPELTPGVAFHSYFARKCGLAAKDVASTVAIDTSWTRQGWMRLARIS